MNFSNLRRSIGRDRLNWLSTIFICFVIAVGGYPLTGTKPFRLAELKLLDLKFQARAPLTIDQRLILISIGDKDIDVLGRWPWPRDYHANLIEVLSAYGASIIAFDLLFNQADESTPFSDANLSEVMAKTGNVCLALALSGEEGGGEILPLDSLVRSAVGLGFANSPPDEDGVVRRVRLKYGGYYSFGLEVYRRYLESSSQKFDTESRSASESKITGNRLSTPLDARGRLMVNYPAATSAWRWVSYAQVLQSYLRTLSGQTPSLDLNEFKGKIVLVGSTITGIPDIIETSLGRSAYGVELHASVINSLLQRRFISPLPDWLNGLIYFSLLALGALLLTWLRPMKGGLALFALAAAMVAVSFLAFFRWGLWVRLTEPLVGLTTIYIAVSAFHFTVVERKARTIRHAFAHYVSPEVVAKLVKDPDSLQLGGEIKEVTVLFSDIRGFTSLSEVLPPDVIGELLNEYFTAMSRQVMSHAGTLDKFIGDAVMAVFGAPLEQPNHARQAALTALNMISELKRLNDKWVSQGRVPLAMGVGLNSGKVKAGNFGGQDRFDYTVIGENVNLASRLEGLTKTYGIEIMISGATRDLLGEGFYCRLLDRVQVKGSAKPVEIFELVGVASELPSEFETKIHRYQQGLDLYFERKWEQALNHWGEFIKSYPSDGPGRLMIKRTTRYASQPPSEEWNGVFVHDSK
ncbi:MAG: adenylate/guanylate cyclase domain-containing protein [Thermodesulfobacteriota bacterium]